MQTSFEKGVAKKTRVLAQSFINNHPELTSVDAELAYCKGIDHLTLVRKVKGKLYRAGISIDYLTNCIRMTVMNRHGKTVHLSIPNGTSLVAHLKFYNVLAA
ncbi:hypothetical protein [Burkholderia phage BCSR5]|nr:hypothetical protein [Burkholderia phage BCSR5]